MEMLDLRTQLRHLYKPSAKEVVRVDVPAMSFLMLDGRGDPGASAGFAEAVEALYSLSYTLKFAAKRGPLAVDYPVMPLEALWWAEDMSVFASGDKSDWQWTMMIMQPDVIDTSMVEAAMEQVSCKKPSPALPNVRFERFEEGPSAQIMHIGPFSAEGPTIERIHEFIRESGSELRGKHHEIYLSDFRRVDPSKWKTVIRQPM